MRTLLSTETECLTVGEPAVIGEFLYELSQLAPSLPGPSGFFNPYGRVYLDGTHLELAAAECADPFTLVQILELQQQLAATAVQRLRTRGRSLLLANCNYSGLLTDQSPTWGSHGNYLVREHPTQLATRLLPFLVTRVYAGAGGVLWPSGEYLSGVRLRFLKAETGGDTMQVRAIHSTARDEPLTQHPQRYGWRYHTVLGDGLRSQFSQLLRFGVTALVLQAISAFPQGLKTLQVPGGNSWNPAFWLQSLAYFNRLERTEHGLQAAPLAVGVQRVYLGLVDRYLETLFPPPDWMRQVVTVWEATLNALERNDHAWLAARLDSWIKFELIQSYLRQQGEEWSALSTNRDVASGVALLNQDYHDFTSPQSPFAQLEARGLLSQRVVPCRSVGTEPELFLPTFGTRAMLRAQFLQQHAGNTSLQMDWSRCINSQGTVLLDLDDPFTGVGSR